MTTNDPRPDPRPEFPELRRRFGTPTPEPVETIDHKARALDHLETAATKELGSSESAEYIAVAQVHATLYLAEQQRNASRSITVDRLISEGFGL